MDRFIWGALQEEKLLTKIKEETKVTLDPEALKNLKQKLIHQAPHDFNIESWDIYNYLDARIVLAEKVKDNNKVILFEYGCDKDNHSLYKENLKVFTEYVINNPKIEIRFLVTSLHWSSGLIIYNPEQKKINFLIMDSVPTQEISINRAFTIFEEIEKSFKEIEKTMIIKFYYSIDELQKDDTSCASYSLQSVVNVSNISQANGDVFKYFDSHTVNYFNPNNKMNSNIEVSYVQLPLNLILTKQSLYSKDKPLEKMGLFPLSQKRYEQDKEEFSIKTRKGKSIKETLDLIKEMDCSLIEVKKKKMHRIIRKYLEVFTSEEVVTKINKTSILIKKEPNDFICELSSDIEATLSTG